jgi:hypothetical protein
MTNVMGRMAIDIEPEPKHLSPAGSPTEDVGHFDKPEPMFVQGCSHNHMVNVPLYKFPG